MNPLTLQEIGQRLRTQDNRKAIQAQRNVMRAILTHNRRRLRYWNRIYQKHHNLN